MHHTAYVAHLVVGLDGRNSNCSIVPIKTAMKTSANATQSQERNHNGRVFFPAGGGAKLDGVLQNSERATNTIVRISRKFAMYRTRSSTSPFLRLRQRCREVASSEELTERRPPAFDSHANEIFDSLLRVVQLGEGRKVSTRNDRGTRAREGWDLLRRKLPRWSVGSCRGGSYMPVNVNKSEGTK